MDPRLVLGLRPSMEDYSSSAPRTVLSNPPSPHRLAEVTGQGQPVQFGSLPAEIRQEPSVPIGNLLNAQSCLDEGGELLKINPQLHMDLSLRANSLANDGLRISGLEEGEITPSVGCSPRPVPYSRSFRL
ncbi:mitochondrial import inner membrane translocase [Striga asiatica]|uniref:Mitochondrial import inner membrane translocase n=1 Tax=Striga asiatica TaxID=4170 RepID=A0A5A7Q9L7_STRAF|nr:mitochondrial import inner membrane translocase [Striga asiatica]